MESGCIQQVWTGERIWKNVSSAATSKNATPVQDAGTFEDILAGVVATSETAAQKAAAPGAASKAVPAEDADAVARAEEGAESETDLPLEAYSLPAWFTAYVPERATVNCTVNHDFFAFAEDLRRQNLSQDEQQRMLKSYLDNDPVHQAAQERERYQKRYRHELEEYGELLQGYFRDALEERGIDSTADYYERVVLDPATSEDIHQSMRKNIAADARMQELMGMLGVAA